MADAHDVAMAQVDLSNCDREPIHIPGSIQPHGVLAAATGPQLRLTWVSDSALPLLGRSADELLGETLPDLLGREWPHVDSLLSAPDLRAVNPVSVALDVSGEPVAFDLLVHRTGDVLVCELEPAAAEPAAVAQTYHQVRGAALRLASAPSAELLAGTAAREIRELTGYDRVMVYRFDADWNGEVIAEEKRDDLNPFLGLHYPATDIPAQARALYETNWIRTIVDVGYQPSLLRADPADAQVPLDLSLAVLRSVSPIHIEYLRNMGVSASMSVSLIVRDKLWGLIACHHYSGPLQPPHHLRSAAEFVGQNVSLLLAGRQEADAHERALASSAVQARVLEAVRTSDPDLLDGLLDERLLQLVGAQGAAVRVNGAVHLLGATPPEEAVRRLAEWIWAGHATDEVFDSDALPAQVEEFDDLRDVASGVLATSISETGEQWIVWFRPEVVQTVDWGGDPKNKIQIVNEDASVRLSPRKSFERWKEVVRGRSLPWEPHERAAAGALGRHLTGVLLRHAQQEAEVTRQLRRSLSPEHLPRVPGVTFAAEYIPGGGGRLGGDWFDVVTTTDARAAIAMGDVAGHGTPVAATMTELRAGLRAYVVEDPEPAAVLGRINRLVSHLLPEDMATAVVALLDPATGRLDIASAGHLPPLLVGAGAARLLDEGRGPALGVTEQRRYEQTTLQLTPGETLLLYTDGLIERRGVPIDSGFDRLLDAVGPTDDLGAFTSRLLALAEPEGDDDVAMLAVRWDGTP